MERVRPNKISSKLQGDQLKPISWTSTISPGYYNLTLESNLFTCEKSHLTTILEVCFTSLILRQESKIPNTLPAEFSSLYNWVVKEEQCMLIMLKCYSGYSEVVFVGQPRRRRNTFSSVSCCCRSERFDVCSNNSSIISLSFDK